MTGQPPELPEPAVQQGRDDLTIVNGEYLIRRVDPVYHVVTDPKVEGGKRLSSSLYAASSADGEGMSIDIQASIEAGGHNAREYVTSPKYLGSVRFLAGIARNANLDVGRDPLPDNAHHGQVWSKTNRPFTKAQQKALKGNAEWFVPVDGVSL